MATVLREIVAVFITFSTNALVALKGAKGW